MTLHSRLYFHPPIKFSCLTPWPRQKSGLDPWLSSPLITWRAFDHVWATPNSYLDHLTSFKILPWPLDLTLTLVAGGSTVAYVVSPPLVYILLVRAFSSFVPTMKAWFMPGHTFPDWQECTGAYGNKHYFGDFQVLGCQPGNEISCTVVQATERAQQKHGKYSFRSTRCLSASAIYTQYVLANQGRRESHLRDRREWAKRSHWKYVYSSTLLYCMHV